MADKITIGLAFVLLLLFARGRSKGVSLPSESSAGGLLTFAPPSILPDQVGVVHTVRPIVTPNSSVIHTIPVSMGVVNPIVNIWGPVRWFPPGATSPSGNIDLFTVQYDTGHGLSPKTDILTVASGATNRRATLIGTSYGLYQPASLASAPYLLYPPLPSLNVSAPQGGWHFDFGIG